MGSGVSSANKESVPECEHEQEQNRVSRGSSIIIDSDLINCVCSFGDKSYLDKNERFDILYNYEHQQG